MNIVRRSLTIALAGLAALTAVVSFSGAPAQAVQLYGASGSVGSITPYQVVGAQQRQLLVPGPVIGKASGTNSSLDLRVQYRVYRWNGSSWASYQTVNRNYRMGYASSIKLQGERFNNNGGYFTVQMSFSWHLATNQQLLGARSVNYNGNDYSCSAGVPCSASTGFVYLG